MESFHLVFFFLFLHSLRATQQICYPHQFPLSNVKEQFQFSIIDPSSVFLNVLDLKVDSESIYIHSNENIFYNDYITKWNHNN